MVEVGRGDQDKLVAEKGLPMEDRRVLILGEPHNPAGVGGDEQVHVGADADLLRERAGGAIGDENRRAGCGHVARSKAVQWSAE